MRKYINFILRQPFYFISKILFAFRLHKSYMIIYKVYLGFKGVIFYGKPNYIGINVFIDTHGEISLDEGIVISDEAILLTHDFSRTVVNRASMDFQSCDEISVKDIRLGRYVFVGKRAILMPGVSLPEFTIVGAGSVVTKSFDEPRTIIAGNPARVIKRF